MRRAIFFLAILVVSIIGSVHAKHAKWRLAPWCIITVVSGAPEALSPQREESLSLLCVLSEEYFPSALFARNGNPHVRTTSPKIQMKKVNKPNGETRS